MKPFRLGATCFVYPEDLVSNARQLAGTIDDIELILFDTVEWGTNFPSPAQIADLGSIARDHNLTYTVHLPLDMKLGDAVAYDQTRRAIDVTNALNPFGYVMHLDGRALVADESPASLARWQAEAIQVLSDITEWVGDSQRLCVENVEVWNPDWFTNAVSAAHVSRCIDIGHLWKDGGDTVAHLTEHLPYTRVIHLHGLGTNDHQSLAHMTDAQLFPIVEILLQFPYRGVVTLEVFGPDDFTSSRDTLLRACEKLAL